MPLRYWLFFGHFFIKNGPKGLGQHYILLLITEMPNILAYVTLSMLGYQHRNKIAFPVLLQLFICVPFINIGLKECGLKFEKILKQPNLQCNSTIIFRVFASKMTFKTKKNISMNSYNLSLLQKIKNVLEVSRVRTCDCSCQTE